MDYILSGDPKEVEKVLTENRIRVQRGWITFTPCSRVETDDKYVVMEADSKELPEEADSKELPEEAAATEKPKRGKKNA